MRRGKTIRQRLEALGLCNVDNDEAVHDLIDVYERAVALLDRQGFRAPFGPSFRREDWPRPSDTWTEEDDR